jgi:hypothetical protein
MKITQYMEPMLPCTAFYLLIRVTFSTPTGHYTQKPGQRVDECYGDIAPAIIYGRASRSQGAGRPECRP